MVMILLLRSGAGSNPQPTIKRSNLLLSIER